MHSDTSQDDPLDEGEPAIRPYGAVSAVTLEQRQALDGWAIQAQPYAAISTVAGLTFGYPTLARELVLSQFFHTFGRTAVGNPGGSFVGALYSAFDLGREGVEPYAIQHLHAHLALSLMRYHDVLTREFEYHLVQFAEVDRMRTLIARAVAGECKEELVLGSAFSLSTHLSITILVICNSMWEERILKHTKNLADVDVLLAFDAGAGVFTALVPWSDPDPNTARRQPLGIPFVVVREPEYQLLLDDHRDQPRDDVWCVHGKALVPDEEGPKLCTPAEAAKFWAQSFSKAEAHVCAQPVAATPPPSPFAQSQQDSRMAGLERRMQDLEGKFKAPSLMSGQAAELDERITALEGTPEAFTTSEMALIRELSSEDWWAARVVALVPSILSAGAFKQHMEELETRMDARCRQLVEESTKSTPVPVKAGPSSVSGEGPSGEPEDPMFGGALAEGGDDDDLFSSVPSVKVKSELDTHSAGSETVYPDSYPFGCPHCGQVFRTRRVLDTHVEAAHGIKIDEPIVKKSKASKVKGAARKRLAVSGDTVCPFEGCHRDLRTATQLQQHIQYCGFDPASEGRFWCGLVDCTKRQQGETVRSSIGRCGDFRRHLFDQHGIAADNDALTTNQLWKCRRVEPPKPGRGFSTVSAFESWLHFQPKDGVAPPKKS